MTPKTFFLTTSILSGICYTSLLYSSSWASNFVPKIKENFDKIHPLLESKSIVVSNNDTISLEKEEKFIIIKSDNKNASIETKSKDTTVSIKEKNTKDISKPKLKENTSDATNEPKNTIPQKQNQKINIEPSTKSKSKLLPKNPVPKRRSNRGWRRGDRYPAYKSRKA